jgi:hypothetical protein
MFWPHNWRCVTQRQPLASLIAGGAKQVITHATRPDADDFPLAIVAGENARWYAEWSTNRPLRERLARCGITKGATLPTACVVATAWMSASVHARLCKGISPQERAFGRYTQDMWAWFLIDIFALDNPIEVTPEAGLWTPDSNLAQALHRHHTAKLRERDRG